MIITGYPNIDAALADLHIEVKELPQMRKLTEEEAVEASAAADLAVSCFSHTLNWLATLVDRIEGTAERDKIAGIYDQVSDLRYEVNQIKGVWDK